MFSSIKTKIYTVLFALLFIVGCVHPLQNSVFANPPTYTSDFSSHLTTDSRVLSPSKFGIDKDKTLVQNIKALFYPNNDATTGNAIYNLIKGITLGIMVIFLVWAGASLLFNTKPENLQKSLRSIAYILIGGVLVYGANWLFGSVLKFDQSEIVASSEGAGLEGFTHALIGEGSVMFVVLSIIKAFAFFFAIIMLVITGFRVMAAGDGEKGKKLIKGLVNVVFALFIIKGIDFIYYLTADSENFITNASNFIINVAKVFAYIYGIVIFIMVSVAGYMYLTDGGNGSGFKKASNILINILLSALVLFAFLLIVYQIFAEFSTGGDAVSGAEAFITSAKNYI